MESSHVSLSKKSCLTKKVRDTWLFLLRHDFFESDTWLFFVRHDFFERDTWLDSIREWSHVWRNYVSEEMSRGKWKKSCVSLEEVMSRDWRHKRSHVRTSNMSPSRHLFVSPPPYNTTSTGVGYLITADPAIRDFFFTFVTWLHSCVWHDFFCLSPDILIWWFFFWRVWCDSFICVTRLLLSLFRPCDSKIRHTRVKKEIFFKKFCFTKNTFLTRVWIFLTRTWRHFIHKCDVTCSLTFLLDLVILIFKHLCDMNHSCVWYDLFICVWHDSFIRAPLHAPWLIRTCAMTHSHVRHDSYTCLTWLVHMFMTRLIHTCVPWRIHTFDMTFP